MLSLHYELRNEEGKRQVGEGRGDEGTGSVTLREVWPNPDGWLRPGMFVRAELQEGMRDDALLVPQRGNTRDQTGQATALVVGADGQVEQRKVTIDRTVDTHWLVNDGLAAGDRVIVDGT